MTRADSSCGSALEICSNEEIEFHCPLLDQAMKSNQYQSLIWSVFDPKNPSAEKENIFYCGENPLNCATYKLNIYNGRISVRSPVPGKLLLKHLTKNDLLTYTCEIQLKDINLGQLVCRMNITSSVYCKFIVIIFRFSEWAPALIAFPDKLPFLATKGKVSPRHLVRLAIWSNNTHSKQN